MPFSMASLYTVPLPSVFPAPAPHEWNSTFQAKPKHHWMLPFPISDTQHCESETASAKSACIYFGLDFLIRKDLLRLGWFSVVMSSIGSGLFSRLSRNSVRELLSPLLGEGFSWLMGFGLWTSRTPVFYQMKWGSKNCQFVNSILATLQVSSRSRQKPPAALVTALAYSCLNSPSLATLHSR